MLFLIVSNLFPTLSGLAYFTMSIISFIVLQIVTSILKPCRSISVLCCFCWFWLKVYFFFMCHNFVLFAGHRTKTEFCIKIFWGLEWYYLLQSHYLFPRNSISKIYAYSECSQLCSLYLALMVYRFNTGFLFSIFSSTNRKRCMQS